MSTRARAVPEREALGRRIRAYRIALGLTSRDIAAHTGTGKATLYALDTASKDVYAGTLIDVAAAVGLNVTLAADHHMPLLDLSADEVDVIREALARELDVHGVHRLPGAASALAKLNNQPTPSRRRAAGTGRVESGQVWRNRDPRRGGRLVRVEFTNDSHAICLPILDSGEPDRSRRKSTVQISGGRLAKHDLVDLDKPTTEETA